MTVELLQTLSLATFIAAGVMLLVGVALFFLLDVPKLYGDVSGRTARKAIENIRQQNEATGNKAAQPSVINSERGRLTDRITYSGRLESQTVGLPIHVGTEKFATSILAPQSNETTYLDEGSNETTMLIQEETIMTVTPSGEFTIDFELSFTGSSEIIE